MELSLKNIAFLLVIFFPKHAHAYPNGKVEASCTNMRPNHGVDPQASQSPYSLSFSSTNYTGKIAFQVILSKEQGGIDFKGFMIQARAPDGNTPLGSFVVNSSDVQALTCTTVAAAVSHTSNTPKSSVSVIWLPPPTKSNILFRATVVQLKETFWMDVFSMVLPIASSGPQLLAPTLSQLLLCSTVLMYALLAI